MIFILIKMKNRNTRQKELIQSHVEKMKGFFHVEELYDSIKTEDESIGLATIYRNLKQLVADGTLHSYMCDRRAVYSKTKQHCHFIDEATGDVTHFEIANLDFLKNKLPGSITSFQIEVRGELDRD